MEKTVVKAEQLQLQHNGSKPATTELIAVDDPDALKCPKCLNLLKPPVFQVQHSIYLLQVYIFWRHQTVNSRVDYKN